MTEALELIGDFLLRILPGFLLITTLIVSLPRHLMLLRTLLYILLFTLIRDTMLPLGFWQLGSQTTFWLRFSTDSIHLCFLAAGSLVLTISLWLLDPELRRLVHWHRGKLLHTVLAGLVGLVVIVAPLLVHYLFVPLEDRGGAVSLSLGIPLLAVALAGNLLEELLFRGYFQGVLEQYHQVGETRSAALSGLFFGVCHVFLASTVSEIGWPLILFATWEGVIVAFIRNWYGLLAAVLAHGLAVAVLASAII